MEMVRIPVVVLSGRWEVSDDGVWEFATDTGKMCRCVNVGSCGKLYDELEKAIMREFEICYDTTSAKIGYWIPQRMSVLAVSKSPPVGLSTDEGFANFLAVQQFDKSVNLLVEFNERSQRDQMDAQKGNVIGAGRTIMMSSSLEDEISVEHVAREESLLKKRDTNGTKKGDKVKKKLLFGIDPMPEPDGLPTDGENDFHIRLGQSPNYVRDRSPHSTGLDVQDTGSEEENDSDSSQSNDYNSEESYGGEEEDYNFDYWTDFVNNDCEGLGDNNASMLVAPGAEAEAIEVLANLPNSRSKTPCIVNEKMYATLEKSTLENIYEEIRAEEGFVIVDAPPVFEEYTDGQMELCDMDISMGDDGIYKGRSFSSKKHLQFTVASYAIKRLFHYEQLRSTPKKVVFTCHDQRCGWYILAHRVPNSDFYKLKKVTLDHDCDVMTREQFSKHASAKVISQLLKSKYVSYENCPRARDVPDIVMQEMNLSISYSKAWRVKELAISGTHDTEEASYTLLPAYVYLLRKYNPGTVSDLQTVEDEDGNTRFKYLFLAMGACIQGIKHLRKVVVVDGTHLTGKYKGCLMTACMQDGNFQIFPIAFAVVDGENDDSWQWFFEKLYSLVGEYEDVYFVSDRHSSIRKGIRNVFPGRGHGCCSVHLERNIAAKFRPKGLAKMVSYAASAYRVGDFERFYAEIKKRDKKCGEYLDKIGLSHWTRVHCTGKRYNMMSSNIAETWNGVIEAAKDLPIVAMIEKLRSVLIKWFTMRRQVGAKQKTTNTPEVEKRLLLAIKKLPKYVIGAVSPWGIEVRSEAGRTYHVDLEKRKCSCKAFDELEMPCRHAIAAALATGVPIPHLPGKFHKLDGWINTYLGDMFYVPEQADETIESTECIKNLCPPRTLVPPGRRRKKRMQSALEKGGNSKKPKSSNKCGRCGTIGHNRVTCKQAI